MRLTSASLAIVRRASSVVALDQRIDRVGDLAFDQAAHLEQAGAQAAQFLFILPVGVLRLVFSIVRLPPL